MRAVIFFLMSMAAVGFVVAAPGIATAQLPPGVVSIDLRGLTQIKLVNEKRDSHQTGTAFYYFPVRPGIILGAIIAEECNSRDADKGRIRYSSSPVALSGSDDCVLKTSGANDFVVRYQWSSKVSIVGEKLTMQGHGSKSIEITRDCSGSCQPSQVEYNEEIVLSLSAQGCTIESYTLSEAWTADAVKLAMISTSTAQSTCTFKR